MTIRKVLGRESRVDPRLGQAKNKLINASERIRDRLETLNFLRRKDCFLNQILSLIVKKNVLWSCDLFQKVVSECIDVEKQYLRFICIAI